MNPVDKSGILAMRKIIIAQNEALQKTTQPLTEHSEGHQSSFGNTIAKALDSTNQLQQEAGDLTKAYTMGQTTDIASVMLAKQKASVSFEATLQVRNKLLSAYKDIMSMPV